MMNQAAEKFDLPLLTPHAPEGEQQRVDTILNAIKEHIGFIPDGLRLYSFSPPLLEAFVGNISYFNEGSHIPPSLMALIRYLVSSKANCTFCIDMNEGFLDNMGVDLEKVRASRKDINQAPVDNNEKALLKLALKSVETPEQVSADDLQQVQEQGWTERDIFDAVVQANNNRAFNNILRTFKIEHQGVFS